MAETAFVGLGVMGYPMAGHLHRAGHRVAVYNRTTAKAARWTAEHRGSAADTTPFESPARAAAGARVVFVCVGNDDDVRSVVLGPDGALAAMSPGSVLVDHTTASAELARELDHFCRQVEVGFVDAPISGGQAGAEQGTLTIMCGGDHAPFDIVEPVMAAYSSTRTLIGPTGSGQLTKMVNQIAIAGLLQGLSEAIDFGLRADLDMERVLATISKGAAGSWQMANRGSTMVEGRFDFGFAIEWMRKDLGICLAEGERLGAELAVTRLVDRYYAELVATDGARWDTSALIRRLRPGIDAADGETTD